MQPDRIFGDVADLYDRRRPGYPHALIEAVLDAAPGAKQTIVEAGAGTGKATTEFAARGATVVAVEPDPRMAELCRRNTAGTGRVEIIVARFEDAELEPGFFTMGLAAQSWHWVDPERGAEQMAGAITPGGVFALMWNAPAEDHRPIRRAVEAAYAAHAPGLIAGSAINRRPKMVPPPSALTAPGRFGAPEWQRFPWTQAYTSAEYAELIQTHSDHQALPPGVRAALAADVAAAIDAHGGVLEYPYEADLLLLHRVAPS